MRFLTRILLLTLAPQFGISRRMHERKRRQADVVSAVSGRQIRTTSVVARNLQRRREHSRVDVLKAVQGNRVNFV